MSQRTRVSGHEKEKRRATFNKKLHAVLSTESRAYLKRYVYKITHSFIIMFVYFSSIFLLSLFPLFSPPPTFFGVHYTYAGRSIQPIRCGGLLTCQDHLEFWQLHEPKKERRFNSQMYTLFRKSSPSYHHYAHTLLVHIDTTHFNVLQTQQHDPGVPVGCTCADAAGLAWPVTEQAKEDCVA